MRCHTSVMSGTGRRIGTRRRDETFLLRTNAGARCALPARELLLQVHVNDSVRGRWPACLPGHVDAFETLPWGSVT
jgi:hypothetical protein